MFSIPVSTAIGETNYFKPLEKKVDQTGQVVTAPKNFLASTVKKGHTDDVLFSKPGYIS